MDWNAILQTGLLYGAGLSTGMLLIILVSARVNPEIWLNDYPPDVRAAYGPPRSAATGAQKRLFAIPTFLLLVGILALGMVRLAQIAAPAPGFLAYTVCAYLIFMLFNLVDLLLIDWFVMLTLRPDWMILPGTEGLAGYRDYGFHLVAFTKGSLGGLLVSLLAAGLAVLFQLVS